MLIARYRGANVLYHSNLPWLPAPVLAIKLHQHPDPDRYSARTNLLASRPESIQNPKLTAQQSRYLRYFHKLGTRWWMASHGNREDFAEIRRCYRYPLVIMAYATGLLHHYKLPAIRNLFLYYEYQLFMTGLHAMRSDE